MTRQPFSYLLIAGTVAVAGLAACQPKNPAPAPAPITAAQTQSVPAGVSGRAEINGQPFAGAEVKIYRPGESTPIATGVTGADGKFIVTMGVIATGGGNVIATGGGNVIATGGGNVIATGGGNVIATGGGNLMAGSPMKVVATKEGQTLASVGVAGVIATGGGNVIATGGGNVIATGGGNVIATGGGNYTVMQTASRETILTLATTFAYYKLGDKLDKALKSTFFGDGIDNKAVNEVLASFDKLEAAAVKALENASEADVAAIAQALDPTGQVQLPPELATQLESLATALNTVVAEVEKTLDTVTESKPQTPTDTPTTGTNPNPPANDPPPTTGSGGGNNDIKEDSTNSSGKVSFGGHFAPPVQRGATPTPGTNNYYIFSDQFDNGWVQSTIGPGTLEPVTTANLASPDWIYLQQGTAALRFETPFGDTTPTSFDLVDGPSATIGQTFLGLHLMVSLPPGMDLMVEAIYTDATLSTGKSLTNNFFTRVNQNYSVYNIPPTAFPSPGTIKGYRFTPTSFPTSGMTIYLDDIRYYF